MAAEITDSPKILHLIPTDSIGGVEVAARSMLARRELACPFRLLVIAGPSLAPPGSGVLTTGFRSPYDPRAQLKAVRMGLREAPDVLVASLWQSVLAALAIKLLRPRIRLVFFLNLERAMHLPDALMARLAMTFADAIWADSEATLESRHPPRRTPQRVVSFVTARLAARDKTEPGVPPSFVAWARISPQKGFDRALDLIAALHRRGITARYDIWGPDGGEQAALEAQAARLGIGDFVRFPGPARHEDLPEIAARSRFFLKLSRAEGMAMATVEAMQAGLVPVTTAVGQMAEYVRPGETGILVDPGAIDAGADAVAALLDDEAGYAKLRRGAIDYWQQSPLYADDVCAAARELWRAHAPAAQVRRGHQGNAKI